MTSRAKGTVEQPGRNVRQKAGLNRGILASGWDLLERRLNDKAPGRVVKVKAAYTSLRYNACWSVGVKNRESQAFFRCVACGHTANADLNAACNIRDIAKGRTGPETTAAGHAAARGGNSPESPMNREPLVVLTA
jgi:putative transposase